MAMHLKSTNDMRNKIQKSILGLKYAVTRKKSEYVPVSIIQFLNIIIISCDTLPYYIHSSLPLIQSNLVSEGTR